MKKLLYSLVVLVLSCNTNSYSASSGFGIGLSVGTSKNKITNINELKKLYNTSLNKLYELILNEIPKYQRDMIVLSSSPNPFTETSKFSFDLGVTMFYQIGIKNFFIRPGVFCNFPVANNKFQCEKDNIKATEQNNNNSIDVLNNESLLTHSFDIGGQILFGYNVAKIFSLVLGGEVGYTRWKLKINGKFLKNIGKYGFATTEISDGKVFWRGIIGCEFNFGNIILGLHAFAGPVKLSGNNNSDNNKNNNVQNNNTETILKLINGGARLILAYKF